METPAQYSLKYEGDLRTSMTHNRSGQTVITDAPLDNNGKGESFSPTDLVSTALASCVMTILGIKARDMGYENVKMEAQVWKSMVSNPRRIGKITVALRVQIEGVTDQQKIILERTTRACPVARSLGSGTEKEVSFLWA
ncbi:MAG: OsmC family protein [Flavobacteriales bacterium]|nr:OsmC family protein [Flavobacteriales bacterium]